MVELGVDDTRTPSPICSFCTRLESTTSRSCEAYTEEGSIPDRIWYAKNDHTAPFRGDGGKQFVLLGETRPEDRKTR